MVKGRHPSNPAALLLTEREVMEIPDQPQARDPSNAPMERDVEMLQQFDDSEDHQESGNQGTLEYTDPWRNQRAYFISMLMPHRVRIKSQPRSPLR